MTDPRGNEISTQRLCRQKYKFYCVHVIYVNGSINLENRETSYSPMNELHEDMEIIDQAVRREEGRVEMPDRKKG